MSRIEGRTRSKNDIFQRGEFMRASLNNHPSIPSEFAFGEEMQISLLPPRVLNLPIDPILMLARKFLKFCKTNKYKSFKHFYSANICKALKLFRFIESTCLFTFVLQLIPFPAAPSLENSPNSPSNRTRRFTISLDKWAPRINNLPN